VLDGMVLLGAVLWLAEAAVWSLDAEAALLGLAAVPPIAAWPPLLQESEIMLTEVTCNDAPDCVPWTSTWWPSCGFSMELSPFRVISCPFWEITQLPPDCFRQPRTTVSWPFGAAVGAV